MDHNPYSPPQTEVREPQTPEQTGPRPRQVTWALQCLWIELGVSLLQLILQFSRGEVDKFVVPTLIVALVLFGAEALVIYKLSLRRNWARYVTLAATTLGALEWMSTLQTSLETDAMVAAMGVIELLLDCAALFLIFTRPGKQWFKPTTAT